MAPNLQGGSLQLRCRLQPDTELHGHNTALFILNNDILSAVQNTKTVLFL